MSGMARRIALVALIGFCEGLLGALPIGDVGSNPGACEKVYQKSGRKPSLT